MSLHEVSSSYGTYFVCGPQLTRPLRLASGAPRVCAQIRAAVALRGAPNVIAFHLAWQEGGHLHAQLELCALGSVAQIVSRNGDAPEAPHLWKLPGAARK